MRSQRISFLFSSDHILFYLMTWKKQKTETNIRKYLSPKWDLRVTIYGTKQETTHENPQTLPFNFLMPLLWDPVSFRRPGNEF